MKPSNQVLPLYTFPPLSWWQAFRFSENTIIEVHENWVKQSFRSRYEIAGPNGKQGLSIPTIKKSRIKLKDVRVSYEEDWVTNHLRSVKTAYNNSPFYEHYGHYYESLLNKKPAFLMDLNLSALEFGLERLEFNRPIQLTTEFNGAMEIKPKQNQSDLYNQVFQDKNGFIPDLSFLDLLFNCGPESSAIAG